MEFVRYFNFLIILFLGILWVGIIIYLRLKGRKNFIYLLFFTIFYIYIAKVLDYTVFQFQSLLFLKHFLPNLILHGISAGKSINVIPLLTLTAKDVQTSTLNVLLFIPFGIGLPFITDFRMKNIVIAGALFSVSIEFIQFVTGVIAGITFRIADINDVIFNTLGAAIGYALFIGLVQICRNLISNHKISFPSFVYYIAERPQVHNK